MYKQRIEVKLICKKQKNSGNRIRSNQNERILHAFKEVAFKNQQEASEYFNNYYRNLYRDVQSVKVKILKY